MRTQPSYQAVVAACKAQKNAAPEQAEAAAEAVAAALRGAADVPLRVAECAVEVSALIDGVAHEDESEDGQRPDGGSGPGAGGHGRRTGECGDQPGVVRSRDARPRSSRRLAPKWLNCGISRSRDTLECNLRRFD